MIKLRWWQAGESRLALSVVIVLILASALALPLSAQGAPNSASVEAEEGIRSGNIQVFIDSLAAGGSGVQFGGAAGGGGLFRVEGADIIGPDGKKFIPIGANVGAKIEPYDYYAFTTEGNSATNHSDDAIDWGWNMIRVNVVTVPGGGVSFAQTVAGVQAVIDEYTARGIVVMPSAHDLTGSNAPLTHSSYTNINNFWDQIIANNKDNPYVWINYVNEPVTESAGSDPLWGQLASSHYSRVRQETSNIFVVDLPAWAQGANEFGASSNTIGADFLAGKSNVVFSWHNYGSAGSASQMSQYAQNMINKGLAVMIGEFGNFENPDAYPDPYPGGKAHIQRGTDWTFDNFWTYGFGGLWWHGTGAGGNYALHTDNISTWYADHPLSAAGVKMRALPSQKP